MRVWEGPHTHCTSKQTSNPLTVCLTESAQIYASITHTVQQALRVKWRVFGVLCVLACIL